MEHRDDGCVIFHVFLTNHGVSTAFNVRFGVEINGERYPYRYGDDAAGIVARQVVPSEQRIPSDENSALPVVLTPEQVWGSAEASARRGDGVVEHRVFWATYENPCGETWETRNPADPTGDLVMKRVSTSPGRTASPSPG